jgi:RNA polymerase sigma factor (sigma-70 family)
MPHEASVRAWLSRSRIQREEADDLIQETYCRIAGLEGFEHIDQPGAYFFSAVRNLLVRRLARARVVPLVPIGEVADMADSESTSPEQNAGGRLDYTRMLALLDRLPERRRRIVQLRKIEGKSQREISRLLQVSENIVEHEVRIGLLEIQKAWRQGMKDAAERFSETGPKKGRWA